MSTFRAVYPELQDDEYKTLITPLDEWDGGLLDLLTGIPTRADHEDWVLAEEGYPFQRIIRSFAVEALDAFPVAAASLAFGNLAEPVLTLLTRLETRLSNLLARSLTAGINNAREKGLLIGDSSAARYASFEDRCITMGVSEASNLPFELLTTYRQRVVDGELRFLTELCGRVQQDRKAIAKRFGIATDVALVDYGLSGGDTHNHGRSVTLLLFENGRRLVYKPRDISCEAAYEDIADRMNDAYGTNLTAAVTLPFDDYGYVEFVETIDPAHDLAEFFKRCGELGAVLYLLNSRDMHFENIVASPRGPVPVDLETIMHPTRIHVGPIEEAPNSAHELMQRSVATLGLLPLVLGSLNGPGHIDLGFLGDDNEGVSPLRSLMFDKPFTDEMSLKLEHAEVASRDSVISGVEEAVVVGLGEGMADAFERVLRAIHEKPEAWNEILDLCCTDVTIRYIHNPTMVYERMHRLTASAQALCRPDYVVALLKRLALLSGESDPRIAVSEMFQIAERDVPYFIVDSDSRALLDGDRRPVGPEFQRSPIEEARTVLARLNETTIERETDAIRLAFVARFPDNALGEKTADAPQLTDAETEAELRALAHRTADELADEVLADRFDHLPKTWIGPLVSTIPDRPWSMGVLGYDLYTGRVGPALALLLAGDVLGCERFWAVGSEILDASAQIVLEETYEDRSLAQVGYGAFTGLGGLAFVLDGAGRRFNRDEWRLAAQRVGQIMAEQVFSEDPATAALDVISGICGVALTLCSLPGEEPESWCGDLGQVIAQRVLAGADQGANELLRQSGFAHGTAGALYTLCAIAERLGNAPGPIDQAIRMLDEHLDTFFVEGDQRWASNDGPEHTFSTGWCHGAGGIALALAAIAKFMKTEASQTRLEKAGVALIEDGFGRNLTWCHGDLGNHDALMQIEAAYEPARVARRKAERQWLFPENLERGMHDPRSRYAYANAALVGSSGVLLHVLNRLDRTLCVSPTRLSFGTESEI